MLLFCKAMTFIGDISSLIDEDNSLLELSLEDLHGALDVRSGIVEMILAENHPAGLGIPRILVVKPLAIIFHGKRKAHNIVSVVVFVFLLVSKIAHRIHQLRLGQRIQMERKPIGLGALWATCRIRGAPHLVALHTSHKVGSDSRAGDFHCF